MEKQIWRMLSIQSHFAVGKVVEHSVTTLSSAQSLSQRLASISSGRMPQWIFSPNCRTRYDSNRIILVRFDYRAHFFEASSDFLFLFHLLERGITTDQLERFIKKHKKLERGKLLAVIRDLENQKFLIQRSDYNV